ncbi:MAG: NapC/NirT family cytochrome c [Verrucomicrobia bacterium]|nr:NapC/NirT family cytochrome c [Verrucomicrobiota bacterium]
MSSEKSLLRNCFSLLGIVISLGALFVFALLMIVDVLYGHSGPYFGLVAYIMVPGALVCGLGLIVAGVIMQYLVNNYQADAAQSCSLTNKDECCCCTWFKGFVKGFRLPDLNISFTKFSTWVNLVVILIVLGISGAVLCLAAINAYHWTEDDEFCGELCHVTMEPENVAHKDSPHANVACVECHVGPGIDAYAYAKINGIRQLAQNVTKTYHTPIHVPVSAMYGKHLDGKTKTEHTCMSCHWNPKYVGNKEKSFTHFLKNEEDLKASLRMSIKVGGCDPKTGIVGGAHSHVTPNGKKLEFITDNDKRNGEIVWIRQTFEDGKTKIYTNGEEVDTKKQTVFTMGCMDCHNRPAHRYASPVTAVDMALELGTLPLELGENVKYTVIELLTGEYETKEEAMKAIKDGLTEMYGGDAEAEEEEENAEPANEHLEQAIKTVQNIYSRNIFPAMKASWQAYPDNIGHKESIGCARCHNESLVDAEEGEPVRNGCQDCHLITAQFKDGEWDEADIKGLEFQHLDGNDQSDITTCSKCHTGTY